MDETFGEGNFITNIIWQKKFSPQNDAKYFSDNHDFIVVYAKHKNIGDETNGWVRNLLPRTEEMEGRYSNPDNDSRGPWTSGDLSVKTYSKEYDYPIKTPSGKIIHPPQGCCWRTSKENFQKMVEDNRILFGRKGDNVPRIKRFLSEVQAGLVPVTIWTHQEVGHNQSARQDFKKIFPEVEFPFENPKPVSLIERILQIATDKDSIIIDSFAGSGTTAHAVLVVLKIYARF
jgi:adenine-specific DNA-methyltransferase